MESDRAVSKSASKRDAPIRILCAVRRRNHHPPPGFGAFVGAVGAFAGADAAALAGAGALSGCLSGQPASERTKSAKAESVADIFMCASIARRRRLRQALPRGRFVRK